MTNDPVETIIQNAKYLESVLNRYNQALIDLNELLAKYTERKDERAFINSVVIYMELREFRDKFLGGPQ